jgi:hypothetical protein
MRRKAAFQRTIDESKNYQDALNSLLDAIRDGPSQRLDALFDYVRSGATNQEITLALQHQLSRPGDEDGDEPMSSQADGTDSALEDAKPGKSPADMSNFESAASESGRGKTTDAGLMPISTLLFSLKNCSESQGEALLRRFLAFREGEKVKVSPPTRLADGKSPAEGAGPGVSLPSVAERAMWHPVLHIRSHSSRAEARPQV